MDKIHIALIIGTRPELIKSAPLIKEMVNKEWLEFQVWNTGQHYDYNMDDIFTKELLREHPPDINFEVGSDTQATQLSKIMIRTEEELLKFKPDLVIVIGDTNSSLGAALITKKLNIPLGHIEAGPREFFVSNSFLQMKPLFYRNIKMLEFPEEVNRIIIDHCSTLLFAPTKTSKTNLLKEKVLGEIFVTGDLSYDIFLQQLPIIKNMSLQKMNLCKGFNLVTLHRAENTDDEIRLKTIMNALIESKTRIVFPMHPRTKKKLLDLGIFESLLKNSFIYICEPLGYNDFLNLIQNANKVFTDSGGVQKEAFFMRVPCVILRECSGWIEPIKIGVNKVVGFDKAKIIEELQSGLKIPNIKDNPFGNGDAAKKIINVIYSWWTNKKV